jgi:hypothetical protein
VRFEVKKISCSLKNALAEQNSAGVVVLKLYVGLALHSSFILVAVVVDILRAVFH